MSQYSRRVQSVTLCYFAIPQQSLRLSHCELRFVDIYGHRPKQRFLRHSYATIAFIAVFGQLEYSFFVFSQTMGKLLAIYENKTMLLFACRPTFLL